MMKTASKLRTAMVLAVLEAVAGPAAAQSNNTNPSDPMLVPPAEAPVVIASWEDALARVRTGSPEYASSLKSIDRSRAQARLALAPLLPTVTGQATYTHAFNQLQIPLGPTTLSIPPTNDGTVGATVSWTPINPRAYFDWETSRHAVDVTRLDTEDKRRQIATGIVAAMLATLSGARVSELNRVGLRAALDRQRLTETRLAYGQGTQLDVERAQKDVAAARHLVVVGDESLHQSREVLAVALGSREPVAVATSLEIEGFERAVASTCKLNDALENRPDVVAARDRVELAKRAVTSAELAPLPTLGIQAQASYSTDPTLGPNDSYSFAALLRVPFYDGGVRYGQLRDARAAEAQARAALEEVRLNAITSSARTRRAVEVARSDRDVSTTQRNLAAQIDTRTRDGYRRGLGTSLDLVTSAEQLRSAEISLAVLEFQYAEGRAAAVLESAQCAF